MNNERVAASIGWIIRSGTGDWIFYSAEDEQERVHVQHILAHGYESGAPFEIKEVIERPTPDRPSVVGLPEILREAAEIISGRRDVRWPIVDELEGLALMLESTPGRPSAEPVGGVLANHRSGHLHDIEPDSHFNYRSFDTRLRQFKAGPDGGSVRPLRANPVEPMALSDSIAELDALMASDCSEPLTQSQSESIMLSLHELKRLMAVGRPSDDDMRVLLNAYYGAQYLDLPYPVNEALYRVLESWERSTTDRRTNGDPNHA